MEPIAPIAFKILCALIAMRAIVHHLITPAQDVAEATTPARSPALVSLIDGWLMLGAAILTAYWVRG